MTRSRERDATVITVTSSPVVQQATGAIGVLLETQELGPIVLPLNLEAIAILRQVLADAEALLRRGSGTAQL
jgi:hypothetical protein